MWWLFLLFDMLSTVTQLQFFEINFDIEIQIAPVSALDDSHWYMYNIPPCIPPYMYIPQGIYWVFYYCAPCALASH
jgi:hypothetical protein